MEDLLTKESAEFRELIGQLRAAHKSVMAVRERYRPTIADERYLKADEVMAHAPKPARQPSEPLHGYRRQNSLSRTGTAKGAEGQLSDNRASVLIFTNTALWQRSGETDSVVSGVSG
jgi:hypothetical protein